MKSVRTWSRRAMLALGGAAIIGMTPGLAVAAPVGAINAPMAITGPSPAGSLRAAVRVHPPAPPPQPAASQVEQVASLVNAERARAVFKKAAE